MALISSLQQLLGRSRGVNTTPHRPTAAAQPKPTVAEVTAAELMLKRQNGHAPLLLDCREPFERRMGYIPGSLHIPMNQIPGRLAELDRSAQIVVVCAHGNRSYSVAGWLLGQGFDAVSLRGGMADWQARGGAIERPAAS